MIYFNKLVLEKTTKLFLFTLNMEAELVTCAGWFSEESSF